MMVVWIKCFECTHFACEQTGRFDCAAFLPQKGIPAPVYGAPMTLPHCGYHVRVSALSVGNFYFCVFQYASENARIRRR